MANQTANKLTVENAFAALLPAARAAMESGAEFLPGYQVSAVTEKAVTITRLATGSTVVLGAKFVASCAAKLLEYNGVLPRRALDYTVAKESSLVHLHPCLDWSADGKKIVAS